MGNLMAGQRATVGSAVIGNRSAVVLTHHVDVEIHQALARHPGSHRTHAVRGMTRRTGESILRYVIAVMGETRVTHDVGQIMALGAHAVRSVETEVRIGEQVRDLAAWGRGLTELIVVLEDVRVDRAVRAIGPESAKLAIVVAVMAIAAQNPDSLQTPCRAILIQHVGEQTGLRQRAQTVVRHGMARGCTRAELGNYVQGIGR